MLAGKDWKDFQYLGIFSLVSLEKTGRQFCMSYLTHLCFGMVEKEKIVKLALEIKLEMFIIK
jgi:hypothetical protein